MIQPEGNMVKYIIDFIHSKLTSLKGGYYGEKDINKTTPTKKKVNILSFSETKLEMVMSNYFFNFTAPSWPVSLQHDH